MELTNFFNKKLFLMNEFTSTIDEDIGEKIFNKSINKFSSQTLIMIVYRQSIIEICNTVFKIK